MDPLTNLYDRLRQQSKNLDPSASWPDEPPLFQDWLRFWNDEVLQHLDDVCRHILSELRNSGE